MSGEKPFPVLINHPTYALIWYDVRFSDWLPGELPEAPRMYLPFLVDGEARELALNGKSVALLPLGLVRGILETFESPMSPADAETNREWFAKIFPVLVRRFNESAEQVVLDMAQLALRPHGAAVAFRFLVNGLRLVPTSSRVRVALIEIGGRLMMEASDEACSDLARQIVAVGQEVRSDDLPIQMWTRTAYFRIVALACLERGAEALPIAQSTRAALRAGGLEIAVTNLLEKRSIDWRQALREISLTGSGSPRAPAS